MASKVFISHSAKSAAHKQFRDQLVAELKAVKVDAWVDEAQIEAGDEWLKRITEGLGECYAGIILFSSDTLDSDFVKYEVSCLAQRKRMHSGFGLFALNLGDVDIHTIEAGFYGSIRFPDYQIKDFINGLAEVVNKVKALRPPELTPTRVLEGDLIKYFRDISPEVLRAIARKEKWLDWDTLGADSDRLHFVRMLMCQPLTGQIRVLKEVMGGLGAGYDVRQIFDKLAPTWVDENAALQLDTVKYREDEKRGALVNGKELAFTCEAFFRRARPISGQGLRFHESIPKGRQVEKRLAQQVRENLSVQFNVKIPKNSTPQAAEDAVNEKLADMEELNVHAVQALQLKMDKLPPKTQLALLKGLQKRFPKVTFVAMTGGGDFPVFDPPIEDNVRLIEPALTDDPNEPHHNERYARKWYDLGCEAFEALKPPDREKE